MKAMSAGISNIRSKWMEKNFWNYKILAYLTLGVYILIVGKKRIKNIKITLTSLALIFVFITVGARIVWYISSRKPIEYLFALKFAYFKISGAIIGGFLAIFILTKIFKKEKRVIVDTCTEAMFLCGCVAKIECFMGGCCLGKIIAPQYKNIYSILGIHNFYPVQLYESFILFITFILLRVLKDKVKDSTRISVAVVFYILVRMFILEGLYMHGNFMGNERIRIIYFFIILICVATILYDFFKKSHIKC